MNRVYLFHYPSNFMCIIKCCFENFYAHFYSKEVLTKNIKYSLYLERKCLNRPSDQLHTFPSYKFVEARTAQKENKDHFFMDFVVSTRGAKKALVEC